MSTQGLEIQTLTCEKESLYCQHLSTYLCVLLVIRLFLVKYCFFNRLEETFKLFVNLLISPCQILYTSNR